MSVYGMMRTSVSGMAAQANRLAAVGDNIANVSTVGYKSADIEFETLVINSGGTSYTSGGVASQIRYSITEQGSLQFTASPFDLAITGNGFFVVNDPTGEFALTRAGSFVPDKEGQLVNSGGMTLMGVPITDESQDFVVNDIAGLEPVTISTSALRAEPSRNGTLKVNLPAAATVVAPADLPSANGASAQSSARSSVVAYDGVGQSVVLDVYYTRAAAGWEVAVFDAAGRPSGGGFPYAAGPLATQSLTFDANGQLAAASASSISIAVPNGEVLDLDLSGTSQLAADYSVVDIRVDGTSASSVAAVDVDSSGIVYAVFQSGERAPVYRLPLATVTSPDKLQPESGNIFTLTLDAGELRLGSAESAGFGRITSGALENSTVDLADELTRMIEAQRNYTANSKVFQTGAELIDVVVNLKR